MDERRMKVAMIQSEAYGVPASFDVERNRAYYVDLVDRACAEHKPDLVGLTEVFTSPYFCASHDPVYWGMAEPIPGPSSEALAELARKHGCYIFAPLFEKALEGEYYDSCALIDPDGKLVPGVMPDGRTLPAARKIHIPNIHAAGTITDEKFWFKPGQGLVNFDTRFGRIGCLVCYDRSFPEAWRTLTLAGAEAVFVPVVSYGFREVLFIAELQTRASENGVFVLAANRAGPEAVEGREVTMFGNSCVISPTGELLARGASGSEGKGAEVVVFEIDLAEVGRTRVNVPYLRDRRPEVYALA
jgi:N-carbamoylputrescine amidase